ncbi:hypothetical protein sscle_10g075180 [Sclerotinia sclerotiorum 1980 UF-70]|uniref:Uncharacterized protein n=1 Tax=Sclerotinia sclerotiorum (strain ATCC 18683 / 1980 / Ss-1) TaxID=665079 RepID=A0A1D9QCW6_SCLS1|nr:hypothetical protein sscle_10g075180 [Sclerotinia sclerotiorum 1980 UF-70]
MTVAFGTVVSARAVERSDRSFQQPITDPSLPRPNPSSQFCIFTPSLPMPPASFTSTLPSSLHHHLPNVLLSNSFFNSNLPASGSTVPMISSLSLSEETGDASLQGIFLGLVYTPSSSKSSSPPPSTSLPKPQESKSHRCSRPPKSKVDTQDDFDKSWSHVSNHEIRSPILSVPQSTPSMEMRRCFTEAVEGIRGSEMVEGTLNFPEDGGRMRFLIWRVD